ncbi:hypothetical protein QLQ12_34640 [Actinoplanes sp. NEAU-A12]|uniref:Uncharacterized protein n=1 Tax=Actinoplanes sandaracinus TaxID=3045177 RepID=A0ABT6WVK9_9ACTN|nr:hypothetical protein [Actinoplanes sandaracinus]MDI6103765.1 hypothetical protein [Actinoplanes sandaracinus]
MTNSDAPNAERPDPCLEEAGASSEDEPTALDLSHDEYGSTELNLSDDHPDPRASRRGLDEPSEGPPPDHVRAVAFLLLWIFGLCLGGVVILATVIAMNKPDVLKDMVAFFSTIVATLGTLIGGVVAFYFARR